MAGVLALALPALCWTISLRVRDSAVAEVSPSFIGSTLDVGVAYDLDSVKSAPYDLSPPQLVRLARGLSPGFLRIGGSTQDKLRYEPPQGGGCAPYAPPPYPCAQEGGTACLTLKRWRELHAFAADANLSLIFGLNACTGRPARDQPMDLTQTLQLLNYTARHGLPVYAFELGNELDGSYHGSDGVAPSALAADLSRLAAALRAFWPDAKSRPRLLAPDVVVYTGSVGMNPYFEAMLDSAARDEELGSFEGISSALNATKSPPISSSLSGITFHQYPYCDRPDEGAGTILDLHCLGKLSQAADEMSALGARHGGARDSNRTRTIEHPPVLPPPGRASAVCTHTAVKAYAGEGSNCWTGGVANVSDVFLDTFYYSLQARENPAHVPGPHISLVP